MKRRISDLMKELRVEDVELEYNAPLSSRRIEELTMNKITKKETKPKHIGFRLLIAAAVIMALAVTAFAAGGGVEWFMGYFARNSKTELSAGQIEFIDENAVELNQSQTIGDYTVTLESYISGGSEVYLKMSIQAPADIGLSKYEYSFGEIDALSANGEPACGVLYWEPEEKDKNTNTATYMLSLSFVEPGEDYGGTNVIVLELTDLYDGPKWIKGSCRFEIEIPDESIELLEEPLIAPFGRDDQENPVQITVTSARLRAMGLRLMFEPPVSGYFDESHCWEAKAVMEDGSTVDLLPAGFGRESDDEGALRWVEYYGGILALDEIAYIELHGGVQLPVNEE